MCVRRSSWKIIYVWSDLNVMLLHVILTDRHHPFSKKKKKTRLNQASITPNTMTVLRLVLPTLFSSFFWRVTLAQPCYFPNGNLANQHISCQDGGASACCDPQSVCLTNGFCMSFHQPYVLSRGSCTDQSWQSSTCPNQCQNFSKNGGCSIVLFNNSGGSAEYCCNSILAQEGSSAPICAAGVDPFIIPDGNIIPGKGALAQFVRETEASSPTSSASSAASLPGGCTSTAISSARTSCQNAALGAGIGVPLGVLFLAAAIWAFWERRQRRRVMITEHPLGPYLPSTYNPFTGTEQAMRSPKSIETRVTRHELH
ncbi:hypothetical protein F5Y15DRAFT_375208 [Xylariaceae sp. FL0016]|nr:hypothetical protein F5Y15DRAFT_375208 [Xylariaceae sp. FL0016]